MEMLAMDRRNLILERIQKDTSVRVGDLAKEYKVTEETIRRDLEKLEKDGLVTRTYGGAVLTQTSGTYDFSFRVRETQNVEGKRRIALKVAEMIEDGDKHADLILQAQAYQIAKTIGLLSIVLKGDCDAIILTGGMAHSKMLTQRIKGYVEFLAPVVVMPGENEMEALAQGGLRLITGQEKARVYQIPSKEEQA